MAVHRDVWVECDFCNQTEFAEGNVTDKEARRVVRTNGSDFRRVIHNGKPKDICPTCYELKRHKE